MTNRVREAASNYRHGGEGETVSDAAGRLLLVDDDDQLRALFSRALRLLGFVVDEERTLQSALARLEKAPAAYDYAEVDLGLPEGDGADLQRFLRRGQPPCGVIVLAEHLTARRVLDLEGHALVLPKPVRIEELVEAIGKRPARILAGAATGFADRFGLTKAEHRVLDSLNDGHAGTRAERARRLGCQPATYAKHLQNIFTKTNCHSADELCKIMKQYAQRDTSSV